MHFGYQFSLMCLLIFALTFVEHRNGLWLCCTGYKRTFELNILRTAAKGVIQFCLNCWSKLNSNNTFTVKKSLEKRDACFLLAKSCRINQFQEMNYLSSDCNNFWLKWNNSFLERSLSIYCTILHMKCRYVYKFISICFVTSIM